ncbi:hypothetical protein CK503_01205 [Aliifodinibius salipaludis]|uniref:LTD domain-containing protein n=1 Tax=Fodinibius salipaludis TaxID=2032627 RepID=A0A2A2GFJ6_9BACT|nr:lamin tail domain-containing protein [Aliifodinibius salipaludis]PAU95707.1 hypothetical protein CK503_01205 [Aliifodinibius salipaludis]
MGIGLPSNPFLKIFLVVILLLGVALQEGYGQSTGDLAVIGVNSDGDDNFAITTFVDIPSGTTIYFTDRSWDGRSESFSGNEGVYSYTVPQGGFNAGKVVVINPDSETASDDGTVSHISGNFNLTNGDDELYFYLSTSDDNPSSFLFAITNDDAWDDSELNNMGLNDGTTALSNINENGEYVGPREATLSTLKEEIRKVENNWLTTEGTGDQSIAFNTSSFSLVDLPTVAFNTSAIDVLENSATAELTVELVESNNQAVDVDIAYLSGSGTAESGDDFYNETGSEFSTETISFGSSEGDGTTKTVTLNLENDSEFEGPEKAVFQLQNISDGTIIGPDVLTLTIKDDDIPDIVINEIYANPADGSGARTGEFIEFVNNQDSDIDISGWKVFQESDLKHTFPDGTVLPGNRALVLFSGDDDVNTEGNYGGALIQRSSESATLSLDNGGDIIRLEDSEGNDVINLDYPSANNNESIVRDPEITGDFVDHSTVSDKSILLSPGTKVDGKAFGSKYAKGIRGSAGWRMISTPTENTSFADLFGNLRIQGVPGSDDPSGNLTLAGWSEDQRSFTVPSDMSNNMSPGKGYIVYVPEDKESNSPGIQGGFSKVITTDGVENSNRVNVTVSARDFDGERGIDGDEGWNLLGNPFGTDISVGALIDALEDVDPDVNANIYVWDHEADGGNGKYITLSDDGLIAPFQAFFVRFTNEMNEETFTFDKSVLESNTGTELYKNSTDDSFAFDVRLHGEEYFDTYTLEFSDNGTVELDRFDAYKLLSLNPNSINLFSTHGNTRLQKNVLPEDLESNLEIPLSFDANGRTKLTFRWDDIDNLPDEWDVKLIDKETDREIDLRTAREYQFTLLSTGQKETIENQELLNKRKASEKDPRFVLSMSPNFETSNGTDLPESVKLNPNYPNPFNPTTTIPYEITEDMEVKLTIWNMIGQKVATLVDGMVEAGTHEETWNASNMPSGIYIARFEVGNEVFTRKMTLIK